MVEATGLELVGGVEEPKEKRAGLGGAVEKGAQRVGTIMGAEQILVLDKGEIVGRGTHDELMESCPVYREIADTQLGVQTGISHEIAGRGQNETQEEEK